jgi:hypothetical protein
VTALEIYLFAASLRLAGAADSMSHYAVINKGSVKCLLLVHFEIRLNEAKT